MGERFSHIVFKINSTFHALFPTSKEKKEIKNKNNQSNTGSGLQLKRAIHELESQSRFPDGLHFQELGMASYYL